MQVFNIDEEGRFGGPERRISIISEGLLNKNVYTTVVIPKLDSSHFKRYLKSKNIKFIELDLTRLSLERKILIRYFLRFPLELISLIFLFSKHKPDLIHVNGASQFKVAIAGKISRRKVVWHLNNTYLNIFVKIAYIICSKFCLDGVIYAGNSAGKFYNIDKHKKKIPCKNIEAPVSKEYFLGNIKHNLSNSLNIVCIGGVNPAKGITDLVDVASVCKKNNLNFKISLAGKIFPSQNNYYKKLKEQLEKSNLNKDNFEFLGGVEDVDNLLKGADVLLSMSHREASPMAVWEGLASGKVVISTNVGSVSDYIIHGVNGFIVNIGDTTGVVKILMELINGKFNVFEISECARNTALDYFYVSKIVDRHKEIYNEIVK